MRWSEPIYTGERARAHRKEYRRLLETLAEAEYRQLRFYVIAAPANEKNLMELIPASHLKQAYYRADSLRILGLAADKEEAIEVCEQMIRDCYVCHGTISRELLCADIPRTEMR